MNVQPPGISPAEDPMTYPGEPPAGDAVLDGRLVRSVRPEGRTDLGQWTVAGTDGSQALDDLLRERGAALVAERAPLLAIGSNRCPGQLVHKLEGPAAGRPHLGVLPVVRVRVPVAAGHSAHVGRWGYVPWTPAARPGPQLHWMIWVDADQLDLINRTELPNYCLVDGSGPAVLEASPEAVIEGWRMYRSRHGLLRLGEHDGPLPAGSQDEVYDHLLDLPWFRALAGTTASPADAAAALAASQALRSEVWEEFRRNDMVAADGLGAPCRAS